MVRSRPLCRSIFTSFATPLLEKCWAIRFSFVWNFCCRARPTALAFRNLEQALRGGAAFICSFPWSGGADEKKRKGGNAEGRGGDGLSPVVIHRRPASIDGRERHGGRVHANTCYEQQVRTRPFLHLLLFPPRFHSASPQRPRRSIRLVELAGR